MDMVPPRCPGSHPHFTALLSFLARCLLSYLQLFSPLSDLCPDIYLSVTPPFSDLLYSHSYKRGSSLDSEPLHLHLHLGQGLWVISTTESLRLPQGGFFSHQEHSGGRKNWKISSATQPGFPGWGPFCYSYTLVAQRPF